jgi:Xaa-Pro aminopeptidase
MRMERLLRNLAQKKRLPYLVSDLINIRYLTGFKGSYAYLIAGAGKSYFISDSRYEEYARAILPAGIEFVLQKKDFLSTLGRVVKKTGTAKIFFEEHSLPFSVYTQIKRELRGTVLVPGGDEINELRTVKDDAEIDVLRSAVKRADECLAHILGIAGPGIPEWDLSVEIEHFYRKSGCRKTSFDSIVASGAGSSMPHYVTSMTKRIAPGDMLLIDMGCEYDGYNSDLTRTVFVGTIDKEFKEIYRVVKEAQEAAISAVKPGVSTGALDKAARDVITAAGYGQYFGHSLGHGVGLEVHELPAVKSGGRVRLRKNMAITIEPGIYIPDRGGVRIEDVVVVTDSGCEILTASPKEILII